jgi:hypothetical protein
MMFRVPTNPDNPTFDNTFKVGFVRWLTSSKTDRGEWARRRNAAAKTAETNQNARFDAWADEKIAEGSDRAAKRLITKQDQPD